MAHGLRATWLCHSAAVLQASGEASIATGVDSGLEQDVLPVHQKSMGANQSLQVSRPIYYLS